LMYTVPLASKQLLSNRTMTANFPVFILKPWHLHALRGHNQDQSMRDKTQMVDKLLSKRAT
jgi:hypothetical protein